MYNTLLIPITFPLTQSESRDIQKEFEEYCNDEKYHVILYNDPFNKRAYVQQCLMEILSFTGTHPSVPSPLYYVLLPTVSYRNTPWTIPIHQYSPLTTTFCSLSDCFIPSNKPSVTHSFIQKHILNHTLPCTITYPFPFFTSSLFFLFQKK